MSPHEQSLAHRSRVIPVLDTGIQGPALKPCFVPLGRRVRPDDDTRGRANALSLARLMNAR